MCRFQRLGKTSKIFIDYLITQGRMNRIGKSPAAPTKTD